MKALIVTWMVCAAGIAAASEGASRPAEAEPAAEVEAGAAARVEPAPEPQAPVVPEAAAEPERAAEPAAEAAAGDEAEIARETPPPAEPPLPAPRLRFVDLQEDLARRLHPAVPADLYAPVPPPRVIAEGSGLLVERRFGR